MDNVELTRVATALELEAEKGEAHSHLCHSLGPPWLTLRGNRNGLLRWAAYFIRAACLSPSEDIAESDSVYHSECILPVDRTIIRQHYDSDGLSETINKIEHTNHFPDEEDSDETPRYGSCFFMLGCATVGLAMVSLTVSGVFFWIEKIIQ